MKKKLPKMKFAEDIPAEEAILSEHDQGAPKAAQAGGAQSAGQQIARATGTVMIAFIVVSLIGVVHQMVITRVFGVSASLDSFYAANRITELLFNLMAGGALGSAFIPMFTGFLTREDKKGAWKLASGVLNTVTLILVVISVLVWIFAPQIVEHGLFILAADANLGQLDETVRLLRIMLPSVIIFGISGLVMGMLNAHQSFLVPALAPGFYSLGIIFGALWLPSSWGIDRLAVGVVLGALAHLLVQLPSLIRLPGSFYQLTVGFRDKAVQKVLALMVPRVIGAGVVQLNFLANTVIALSLGEGAASAVTLAFALMLMPQRAIGQSAGIASLPTLSAQAELGKTAEMRQLMASILRAMLLLAAPASVGMIILRVPIVQVLYEGGEFSSTATQMVAWALLWYSLGLIGHSLVEVLSRAFYAVHDTRTPVLVGVGAMSLNILLSIVFSRWFQSLGWMAHGGLALANSLATGLESVILLVLVRKKLQGINGREVLKGGLISLAGSAIMGLAVYGFINFVPLSSRVLSLIGGVVIGVTVYALVLWLLRVPEFQSAKKALLARLHPQA
ncbi:MAG TPA: murein biosynthesis integral membrane protein MurJ [Anaerolineaceae bacterium]|nr:murein biosynthesis integral membrane protein MurJ [Anaerolineaceae bacterium]